jgi:hypothetical protein
MTMGMKTAMLSLAALATALAQDQTGKIEGVVLDSATHQPVKKAVVSLNFMGATRSADQSRSQPTASTDFSGVFSFSGLAAGEYRVQVSHPNYPRYRGAVQKSVRVSAGETASRLTFELVPGGVIAGRVVDEDGDALNGCMVQIHPARNVNQQVGTARPAVAREDGTYRMYDIPPGKYVVTAQCSNPVFQPRPLSEGPDPQPTTAYPLQFYPGATDAKSAQVVELFPGTEKPGIDFQMRPVPVTHIHGTLTAGSADWRDRAGMQIQLVSLDPGLAPQGFAWGVQINQDGSFDIGRVFPGSYRLMAFSQNNLRPGETPGSQERVGGTVRVDVADRPMEISLPVYRAVDLAGTVDIEQGSGTNAKPRQIMVQLTSENQFGGPPGPARVNDDGTFMLKSVLPGEWKLSVNAPGAFLKGVWFGGDDITGRHLNLAGGAAAPLRLLVSTNTASVKGTAPAGQMVFAVQMEEPQVGQVGSAVQADASGQFAMQGLAPGRYRIAVGEGGLFVPDLASNGGGQEVTIREGETATVDVKP